MGWHNDVGYSLGLKSSCLCLYHLWSKSLIQQQAENRTEVDVLNVTKNVYNLLLLLNLNKERVCSVLFQPRVYKDNFNGKQTTQ